jgi:pyruvate/2-oxoglutarate dehydrogenase complex dihydrolipoamide acyltransferase (E2) component
MGISEESGAAFDVSIAYSGLAEEVVVLEWFVDDGQSVQAGSPLVLIESEKTQIEIESPASGRLEIVVPASDIEVAVGTTIGKIWP